MKRHWTEEELIERWTLTPDELPLLANKSGATRLGFTVLLKFFAGEGRFPTNRGEVPWSVVSYVATQAAVPAEEYLRYDWQERAIRYHRAEVRKHFGFREFTVDDGETLTAWLVQEVLSKEQSRENLREAVFGRCRTLQLEPPADGRIERLISSAEHRFEQGFCAAVFASLPDETVLKMDALLAGDTGGAGASDRRRSVLGWLRSDPGRVGLESVLDEIEKLGRLREVTIPEDPFADVSPKVFEAYRRRAATEKPSELAGHPPEVRATLLVALLWARGREITDSLVELLIQVVHRIGARAERRVEKELLEDLKRVNGKTNILFRVAEAAVEHPEGTVREVLFPVVGEGTLRDLIKEAKSAGPVFRLNVHSRLVASYRGHYRRMLPPILDALEFRSNNAAHRPVIESLDLLRRYAGNAARTYDSDEEIPVEGVVPPAWEDLVLSRNGSVRVERVGYEVCVLNALREALRRREVWVVGADRHRDPEEDLPQDFEERRESYYEQLGQPIAAERSVDGLREEMRSGLEALNESMPKNPHVSVSEARGGRVSVSQLSPLPAPPNLRRLREDVTKRWPMTSLLDILKETDLRTDLTSAFSSTATREILKPETLRRRLLLVLFGLGTNAGLKRMASSDSASTEDDLRYVRRKYVSREHLRAAIASLANEVFHIRKQEIWGEATTACASDSKKFGAWDQNLLTEWSIRHRGRGVMIYWHVERKSVCVYSQLKSVSSSEVAAMIEGVLRHCTDMTIEKNYTDSHGASEIAFGFARLLSFELLPRLKPVGAQRLYRPDKGHPEAYPNLTPIMTRPIDWDLIRHNYDQMVKYATALRLGTADAESILRRFSRGSSGGAPMHPTYRALAELGKAVKTIFLTGFLRSEALRREIHEGLNTIESWNAANAFVFYGKSGEISTNRLEEQEVSVLSLHLLQMALVYINTLMIQQVLKEPVWMESLTLEDLRGLTPLIFSHVNPYGTFELDMNERIPLDAEEGS